MCTYEVYLNCNKVNTLEVDSGALLSVKARGILQSLYGDRFTYTLVSGEDYNVLGKKALCFEYRIDGCKVPLNTVTVDMIQASTNTFAS